MAQQPIRLGVSLSITGKQYSVQGGYGREGYLLCQKHVNAQGGVLGRPIEFVIYDDGSDEKTAVRLYEKLIAEDRVDAVLGPYGSAITDAVADVTEKHRKLMIAPMARYTHTGAPGLLAPPICGAAWRFWLDDRITRLESLRYSLRSSLGPRTEHARGASS